MTNEMNGGSSRGDGGATDRQNDRRQVADLMRRIVAGDDAAFFTLMQDYGHRVRFVVRRVLEDMGRRDILRDADEMTGLVNWACLVIRDRAAGWSPDGGAMPWTWASRAIRAMVYEAVGHRVVELDEGSFDEGADSASEVPVPGAPTGEDRVVEEFVHMACRHPFVRLLLEALRGVASERDYEVVLEYVVQRSNGDPSPSHTVAREFDLSPDNVRQIFSRTRRRLLTAIDDDPSLVPLLEIWWLAA
jgi:DNA-directed RNA polymerase specialized sigma24 family protein